jgi:hypothetical protein
MFISVKHPKHRKRALPTVRIVDNPNFDVKVDSNTFYPTF